MMNIVLKGLKKWEIIYAVVRFATRKAYYRVINREVYPQNYILGI